MGYYMKLLADSTFPVLYYVFCRGFNRFYGRCFKLKSGKLCGIILGSRFVFDISIPLLIILREMDENRLLIEISSYGCLTPFAYRNLPYEKGVRDFLSEVLKRHRFEYRMLEEIDRFPSEYVFSNIERLILEEGELILEKQKLERIEREKKLEEKRLERHERAQFLPEKMKKLNPCPFLEVSSDFSDIYVCGASKYTYVPLSSMSESDAIDRCTRNIHVSCKYYLEALKNLKICPFLKKSPVFPNKYIDTCEASKYVHVPFSRVDEKDLLRYCVENRYYDCTYYSNAISTIEKRIKEIEDKITGK